MLRQSTDRRKSSLGTRRGPPRQHIPFRADDLARGKKTGMAVAYVDRNSDEFEPFEQVIKQADNRSPPRIKSKKKRVSIAPPVAEIDEDGEMSMELTESEQETGVSVPSSCLASCRQPGKPPGLLYQPEPRICSR